MMREDIDRLIADRLVERQRKMQRMKEWENAPISRRKWMTITSTISIAACLTFAFFMMTPNNSSYEMELMARPEINSFRAACPEMALVESLMDAGNYEKALAECERILHQSDSTIKGYEYSNNQGNIIDEERNYEYEVECMVNHDIRWTYIYILIKNGQNNEALKQIDKCMEHAKYCDYIEKAKALKKKMKKN